MEAIGIPTILEQIQSPVVHQSTEMVRTTKFEPLGTIKKRSLLAGHQPIQQEHHHDPMAA